MDFKGILQVDSFHETVSFVVSCHALCVCIGNYGRLENFFPLGRTNVLVSNVYFGFRLRRHDRLQFLKEVTVAGYGKT
jgi:hypothetical protein